MSYDPQRHHRHSIRLRDFQYDTAGGYAVTICTEHRQMIFGQIDDGSVSLNEIGRSVEEEWLKLASRYPSIVLDHFVVMPNHLHGILFLSANENAPEESAPTLGTVIGTFKSLSARAVGTQMGEKSIHIWHRNYYEQILRNETMLDTLRLYIENNPAHWQDDAENTLLCLSSP